MGIKLKWDLKNGICFDEAYAKCVGIAWDNRAEMVDGGDIVMCNFEIYASQEYRNAESKSIQQVGFSFPLDNNHATGSWVHQAYHYVKDVSVCGNKWSGSVDVQP